MDHLQMKIINRTKKNIKFSSFQYKGLLVVRHTGQEKSNIKIRKVCFEMNNRHFFSASKS